jgi:hypothetical protein
MNRKKGEDYYRKRDRDAYQKSGKGKGLKAQADKIRMANEASGATMRMVKMGSGSAVSDDYTKYLANKYGSKKQPRVHLKTHKDLLLAKKMRDQPAPAIQTKTKSAPRDVCFKKKDGSLVTFKSSKSKAFCQ